MKTHSPIKGERRANKQHKRRYDHRVVGRSVFVLQRLAGERAERIERKRNLADVAAGDESFKVRLP